MGFQLDKELQGRAREVLMALRQKGKKIVTWEQSFEFKSRVPIRSGGALFAKAGGDASTS